MKTLRKYNGGIIRKRNKSFVGEVNHLYKRIRKTFSTEDQVRAWIDATVVDIQNDNAPLDAFDIREARRALNMLPDGVTLIDAVNFYARNHSRGTDIKLKDSAEKFLSEKKAAGMRLKSITSLRSLANRLNVDLGEKVVSDISSEEIIEWLDKNNYRGTTRDNYRRAFRNLFRWCKKRGYTLHDPTEAITVPMVDQKLPGVFKPDQAKKLLHTAQEIAPELCPYLAFGFFAGIRPAELTRLEWSAIGKHIHIGSDVAKTRQQRYVEISANLKKWIKESQSTGRICPVGDKKRKELLKAVREKAKIGEWPQDVMRHSFATYHLALSQNAPQTAHELGHSAPDMLYRHYRNLATKAEATKYFLIAPKG